MLGALGLLGQRAGRSAVMQPTGLVYMRMSGSVTYTSARYSSCNEQISECVDGFEDQVRGLANLQTEG